MYVLIKELEFQTTCNNTLNACEHLCTQMTCNCICGFSLQKKISQNYLKAMYEFWCLVQQFERD